jgi:hypothetical protein
LGSPAGEGIDEIQPAYSDAGLAIKTNFFSCLQSQAEV